ncbi:MAG: DUF4249 domain-containing protein [Parafilimonas sp.]
MKRFLCLFILFAGCKEAYNPHVKNAGYNYLVVEGNIIVGNDATSIHLSRTITINDTSRSQSETNATVTVESDNGDTYSLENQNNGIYSSAALNISINKNYRVHIFTADGKEYASDFVPVKQTPPIDSVSWKYDTNNGVTIYANAHDETNNTQYYRWEFAETWKHHAFDSSVLIYDNGSIRNRLPGEQVYGCWNVVASSETYIASTAGLSSDVVYEKPLIQIPYGSEKISDIYSIIVYQYALTKEGYEFWDNLKKNTETLGSIFDPQPFTEFGNIHCITDASEPVIGFISACSIAQQRIFIKWEQIQWPLQSLGCMDELISPDKVKETFASGSLSPVGYGSNPPGSIFGDAAECVDCRLNGGGTTVKPSYMP